MSNRIKKLHIERLKAPYIILASHGSDMDYFIAKKVMFPQSICIIKYKLNYDMYTEIKKAIDKKKIIILFPEVNSSLDGKCGAIDNNLADILKKLGVAILTMKNHGSYLASPVWNKMKNDNEVQCDMSILCTKEELINMDEALLQEKINKSLFYDDYGWQRSEKIAIMGKERCAGIEKVLYKCPECLEENKLVSKGDKIYCSSCGKQWYMTEYGDMKATLDEGEYTRIPDWFEYQRSCVREEILAGNYNVTSKVVVEETVGGKVSFVQPGILWHNSEGFILKFMGKGKEETIVISSDTMYTCEVVFDIKPGRDGIRLRNNSNTSKISKLGTKAHFNEAKDVCYNVYALYEEDSFLVTKIMLAVEELYSLVGASKLFVEKQDSVGEEAVTVNVEDLIEKEDMIEDEYNGKVIAVEYIDDNIVTKEQARFIREQAKTVETNEVL